jgi:hypothetical protein
VGGRAGRQAGLQPSLQACEEAPANCNMAPPSCSSLLPQIFSEEGSGAVPSPPEKSPVKKTN